MRSKTKKSSAKKKAKGEKKKKEKKRERKVVKKGKKSGKARKEKAKKKPTKTVRAVKKAKKVKEKKKGRESKKTSAKKKAKGVRKKKEKKRERKVVKRGRREDFNEEIVITKIEPSNISEEIEEKEGKIIIDDSKFKEAKTKPLEEKEEKTNTDKGDVFPTETTHKPIAPEVQPVKQRQVDETPSKTKQEYEHEHAHGEKPKTGLRCPECGSTNLRWDYERGELVCEDCWTIVEESLIDFGPEWRAFDSYQKTKRQRTGSPVKYTKPNKGLVTEIDRYNRDIRGTKLSPQAASQMGRLRKWHRRSSVSSSIERNLTIALGDLDRIASYLGLPANIKEAAALLYRKAVEKGLIRGRLIESVVAAVVYMVCRQYGIPRTLDEITEVSQVSKKEIGRTYRFLKKELYVDVPLTNPVYYVPRFASALGLSGKVQEKAKEILQEAISKGLISGRGPTGVAAAAVYIASVMTGERRTQKEVAEVAGVTEVTIRNRYRELKRELGLAISGEDDEE